MSEIWHGIKQSPSSNILINEDQGELLLGVDTPDWVRLPPELGAHLLKVVGSRAGSCPQCHESAKIIDLENGFAVAECTAEEKFVWFRYQKS